MNKEFSKIAFSSFEKCSISELKQEAVKLFDNCSNEAGDVFDALMQYLESKMSEAEFILFCQSM
jgi:hypothetical protein